MLRIKSSAAAHAFYVDKGKVMIFRDRLTNGVRVVSEYMPGYRSAAMGVWIGAGSVYESGGESGAAHFIEHMLFKGTKHRTAAKIAEDMDAVGGNLNAFTSKECTCFYGRVLDEQIGVLADVLSDLLCDSLLADEDIEREKGVVCEEILMVEDTPEDLAGEVAVSAFYEGDPLAKPILGTKKSVRAFTHDGLVRYMDRLYRPDNMVISVAGSFERESLLKTLEASFRLSGSASGARVAYGAHTPAVRVRLVNKNVKQVHICMNLRGFPMDTRQSYALLLLSNAFGGSMSSRLFQRIREEEGLAYSVYSYPTAYKASGCFTLYAGTGVENAEKVARMMVKEVRLLAENGITPEELQRAKQQLAASFLLSQESTSGRASAIGRAELIRGSHLTEAEILEKISSVTMDDINGILPAVCDLSDISAAVVGRCKGQDEMYRAIFAGE